MDGVPSANNLIMKTLAFSLSKAGSVASLVCAIHCALTPFALLAVPMLAANVGGGMEVLFDVMLAEITEWIVFALIALMAGFGLLMTFPLHRDVRPVLLTIGGLSLIVIAHVGITGEGGLEITIEVMGASLIAGASLLNRRLCHCVTCPASATYQTERAVVRDLSTVSPHG